MTVDTAGAWSLESVTPTTPTARGLQTTELKFIYVWPVSDPDRDRTHLHKLVVRGVSICHLRDDQTHHLTHSDTVVATCDRFPKKKTAQ